MERCDGQDVLLLMVRSSLSFLFIITIISFCSFTSPGVKYLLRRNEQTNRAEIAERIYSGEMEEAGYSFTALLWIDSCTPVSNQNRTVGRIWLLDSHSYVFKSSSDALLWFDAFGGLGDVDLINDWRIRDIAALCETSFVLGRTPITISSVPVSYTHLTLPTNREV